MKTRNPIIFTLLLMALFLPAAVYGFDLGKVLNTVVDEALNSGLEAMEQELNKDKQEKGKDENNQNTQQSQPTGTENQDAAAPVVVDKKAKAITPEVAAGLNGSLFSNSPIDPASLPQPVTSFQAGEHIYGILKCNGSWKQATGETYILMYLLVDGKQMAYKSVGMNRPDLYNSDFFIIDIAPEADKMVNYKDRDVVWREKDGYKFGPEMFTKILSELSPGVHNVRLEVKSYGKTHAAADFTITGDNYQSYVLLLAEIKAGATQQQKMPRAGMTDFAMQDKMIKILKNRGWPEIERLVIVDKAWWLDWQSGEKSVIVSRHIEAAAAAQDTDGSYFYRHATFHEYRLITGEWGSLELTHTGEKKPIPKENINL